MTMTANFVVGITAPDTEDPVATVLSPDGGEKWPIGATRTIAWEATDNVGVDEVILQVSYNGGTDFDETLATGLAASGTWNWSIPLTPSSAVVIKAIARDGVGNEGEDVSNLAFTISDQYPPGVDLYIPSGGETWACQSTQTITWAAADNLGVTAIDIYLSTDGGQTWDIAIATGLPNTGSYEWQVPTVVSAECRVRVRAWDAAGLQTDADSELFTLANLTGVVARAPQRLQIGPCVPNPFNPRTTIHFANPMAGRLEIAIYNLLGRRVRTLVADSQPAGPGQVVWDGRDDSGRTAASGVYYVQAVSGSQRALGKVTLLK
jgi:hypothetical protein